MPARTLPRIAPQAYYDRDGYTLRTPHSQAFLHVFRAQVPRQSRAWRRGHWWVADEYADVVRHLIREHFGEYAEVDDAGRTVIVTPTGERIAQGGLF